jgi:hypothetical protein
VDSRNKLCFDLIIKSKLQISERFVTIELRITVTFY